MQIPKKMGRELIPPKPLVAVDPSRNLADSIAFAMDAEGKSGVFWNSIEESHEKGHPKQQSAIKATMEVDQKKQKAKAGRRQGLGLGAASKETIGLTYKAEFKSHLQTRYFVKLISNLARYSNNRKHLTPSVALISQITQRTDDFKTLSFCALAVSLLCEHGRSRRIFLEADIMRSMILLIRQCLRDEQGQLIALRNSSSCIAKVTVEVTNEKVLLKYACDIDLLGALVSLSGIKDRLVEENCTMCFAKLSEVGVNLMQVLPSDKAELMVPVSSEENSKTCFSVSHSMHRKIVHALSMLSKSAAMNCQGNASHFCSVTWYNITKAESASLEQNVLFDELVPSLSYLYYLGNDGIKGTCKSILENVSFLFKRDVEDRFWGLIDRHAYANIPAHIRKTNEIEKHWMNSRISGTFNPPGPPVTVLKDHV
jgi:hypothetical protein